MSDMDVNITMNASGGSESAQEIQKAESALKNVTSSSSALENQFQHKFQHVGLMLFAGDALRASGLGAEARQAIVMLNMALTAGSEAAGLSSGGFMLIVAALAAVGLAIQKVIEHHNKLAEATAKTVAEDEKQLASLEKIIKMLEGYRDSVGSLNQVQQNYLDTLKMINAEEARKTNADLVARMEVLNQAIAKEKDYGYQIDVAQSLIKGHTLTVGENSKKVEENSAALRKNQLELAEVMSKLNLLHTQGTTSMEAVAKAAKASADATQKAWQETTDSIEKDAREANKEWDHAMDATVATIKKDVKEANKEWNTQTKAMAAEAGKIADQIGSDFGNAMGKMIVEGKNFTDSMRQAFKSLTESIISDIAQMIAKWLIFQAMTGGGGGIGAAGMSGLRGMGFATGGQVLVDQPTLFLAGEAGPEMASFTPLSGAGSSSGTGGGGSSSQVFNINVQTSVTGVTDPNVLAQQLGGKIIDAIRGSGQLNFQRG